MGIINSSLFEMQNYQTEDKISVTASNKNDDVLALDVLFENVVQLDSNSYYSVLLRPNFNAFSENPTANFNSHYANYVNHNKVQIADFALAIKDISKTGEKLKFNNSKVDEKKSTTEEWKTELLAWQIDQFNNFTYLTDNLISCNIPEELIDQNDLNKFEYSLTYTILKNDNTKEERHETGNINIDLKNEQNQSLALTYMNFNSDAKQWNYQKSLIEYRQTIDFVNEVGEPIEYDYGKPIDTLFRYSQTLAYAPDFNPNDFLSFSDLSLYFSAKSFLDNIYNQTQVLIKPEFDLSISYENDTDQKLYDIKPVIILNEIESFDESKKYIAKLNLKTKFSFPEGQIQESATGQKGLVLNHLAKGNVYFEFKTSHSSNDFSTIKVVKPFYQTTNKINLTKSEYNKGFDQHYIFYTQINLLKRDVNSLLEKNFTLDDLIEDLNNGKLDWRWTNEIIDT